MSQKKEKTLFEPERPIVPNNWEVLPFVKTANVISDKGKRLKQRNYLKDGKIPVIDQGQDFIGGYTDNEDMAFDGELPVILFGDHTRSIKFVDKPFVVGAEGIKILKPEPLYEPKFFFYLLKSLKIPSRGYSRHFQFLKKYFLPLAPENEQKRIVAEIEKQFSRLDEAVENLNRIKANLQRYKASVLKAAVEGELTEDWRKAHSDIEPADKLLERILAERRKKWEEAELAKMKVKGKVPKDDKWKKKYRKPKLPDTSRMPKIPRDWFWASLDQINDPTRIITYGVIKLGEHIDDGVITLRSSNVRHLWLEMTNVKKIQPDLSNNYSRTILHGGEVLITIRGTLGGVVAVSNECSGYNISREVAMISPAFDMLPECLAIHIGSKPIQNWLLYNTKGIAYTGINIETLKTTPVPLMSRREQEIIVSTVEQYLSFVYKLDSIIDISLSRAEVLRQSILNKAFSGKLVVQDQKDEPVGNLLKRIKDEREQQKIEAKKERKKGGKTMISKERSREKRDILVVLNESKFPIRPEDLFRMAGYNPEEVEDFYAALKIADQQKAISQEKKKNGEVFLRAKE